MIYNIGLSAVATGTADVITATFSPAITLSDRRIVFLRVATPNTTTTPTFNPNSLGAQVVKGKAGATLKIGELTGDCILMYHTTGTYWEVLNSTPFLDADSSIQTQLNAKMNKPLINSTDGAIVTGTTANTLTMSLLIPANTFTVGDVPEIACRVVSSTILAQKTTRAYINTSAAIGGSQIANVVLGNTIRSVDFARRLAIKSTTSTTVYGITNSNPTSDISSTVAETDSNIDWTVDQYLVVAIQLTSGSDSANGSFLKIIN